MAENHDPIHSRFLDGDVRSRLHLTVSAHSATSATATGNLTTTGNLTSFLDRDLARFKRLCTRDACQSAFNTSWQHLSVLGRAWACIHRGRVFTTDAASCFTGRMLSNPRSGCGICASGGSYPYADRKHCFHRMILAYNEFYRPNFDVCIILNCQDAPILYREGLFSFAYTGSPFSYDVPFPDYSSWQSYPQWLQGLQHSPPPRWHMKLRRAVLVGGQTRASSLRKKLFGGVCDKIFHQLGFVDMVGVDGPFGRSNRTAAVSAELAAALADRNATGLRRLPFIPRAGLCQYRMIVLSEGHSRWLDHLKYELLCKSLVVQLVDLVDPDTKEGRALSTAYSPIERVLQPDVTHIELTLDHSSPEWCSKVAESLKAIWADDAKAQAISNTGEARTRQHYSIQGIYDYVDAAVTRMATIQKDTFDVPMFIQEHNGVEITHENYDNVTMRWFDRLFATWTRPPEGTYTGWHGPVGARIAMEQLRLMLPRLGNRTRLRDSGTEQWTREPRQECGL